MRPGEAALIRPAFSHKVAAKGRSVALKAEGRFKMRAKGAGEPGRCPVARCSLWTYRAGR